MLPLLGGHGILIVATDVLRRRNQEASRSACWIYKDVIFDTSPVTGKVYKIAKTAENKAFLAVFAVFVGVQFSPSEHSRGVPDAGIWAPARLAQGIIKKYAKIKWFRKN